MREAHSVELLKKDKKLAQLKELAMAKATEKLKERDAMILRLKKEKLRITQEREEDVENLVRQHRNETEELQKQLKAKTEAVTVLRQMLADFEKDENGSTASVATSSAAPSAEGKAKVSKAEHLVKLQNIQIKM